MNVLYITGACLDKNTSANMSHNGYIKGLIDNGANIEIIMANDSYGEVDSKLKRFNGVKYYTFNSISFSNKILRYYKNKFSKPKATEDIINTVDEIKPKQRNKRSIRNIVKNVFYTVFKQDPIYPLDSEWLKNASKFKSNIHYDLVISNSSPAASHKLVSILKKKGNIKFTLWAQIWEDPWFYDIYGGHSLLIKEEEKFLLKDAEKIYYVSPLTLFYQKKYFKEYSKKMNFVPLPFFEFSSNAKSTNNLNKNELIFGYFGDYFSHTRNLLPFYNALKKTKNTGYIIGDSDLNLVGSDKVHIKGRITLDLLEQYQCKASILVHVCNLRGGQIPGKIYHYSATYKPILFILDGSEFEMNVIKDYFSKYNRYYFCKNNVIDIENAIHEISANYKTNSYSNSPVKAFVPQNVVYSLLTKLDNTYA